MFSSSSLSSFSSCCDCSHCVVVVFVSLSLLSFFLLFLLALHLFFYLFFSCGSDSSSLSFSGSCWSSSLLAPPKSLLFRLADRSLRLPRLHFPCAVYLSSFVFFATAVWDCLWWIIAQINVSCFTANFQLKCLQVIKLIPVFAYHSSI